LPAPAIEAKLREEWGASPERARLLGRLCAGSLGWAVSFLREEKLLEPRAQRLEMLKRALGEGLEGRFSLAAELAMRLGRQRELAPEWFDTWLSWWRDLLVIKGGTPDAIVNVDEEAILAEQARACSLREIVAVIDSLQAAKESIDSNVNIRLMLETLMLDLPISKGRKEEKEALV
ncbi:MAG: hypothetical protein HY677_06660, partial [Chloroflexi bacterium]|nr:hypothetical protein [Chloroflexota bacterium]